MRFPDSSSSIRVQAERFSQYFLGQPLVRYTDQELVEEHARLQELAASDSLTTEEQWEMVALLVTMGCQMEMVDRGGTGSAYDSAGSGWYKPSGSPISLSRQRAEHILSGTGGRTGHAARFNVDGVKGPEGSDQFVIKTDGKSFFDASLSDRDIIEGVIRIANTPASIKMVSYPLAESRKVGMMLMAG